jgi:exopolysaccharide biosynthesis protein
VATIPGYREGELRPGRGYSSEKSWYEVKTARTVLGLAGPRTLYIFTVDRAGGSEGMTLAEVADLLIRDYNVSDALNLDGGGSTTLAMEDPRTHMPRIVNVSSDNPNGRSVASSLAIFIR